jgi:hypothetical protein
MLLTREQILAARDVAARELDIPEWGGRIRLRAMTGVDRDEYMTALAAAQKAGEEGQRWHRLMALLVVLCAVDADGNRIFERDDAESLAAKSAAVLERISGEIQAINALGEAQVEQLGNG